jgi:uncharacterized phage-like protein YoqJ
MEDNPDTTLCFSGRQPQQDTTLCFSGRRQRPQRDTTLCFSGHRCYAGAPDDEARLAAAVEAAWETGYRTFISGMAQGFDLAAAEAVVRLREHCSDIKLIAAVPFARQTYGYSAADRTRHEALLAAADEVHVLGDSYSHGIYYRRDDWMVERSARIICWYDGSNGGTRYTVRRAVKAGLEVVNLFRDPNSLF